MPFKDISYPELSCSHLVRRSGTIQELLVKGFKSTISVKLFLIWTSGLGGDVV